MIAVFFVFRMRFYAAWCGAEATCISAGLGCYPEKALSKPGGGPTVNYRYTSTGLRSIIGEDSLIIHSASLFISNEYFLLVISTHDNFFSVSVLTPPAKRSTTSKPSRTLTATTLTSVWRSAMACVTGTWQCSGGYITTFTPMPPSNPTLSGQITFCLFCMHCKHWSL